MSPALDPVRNTAVRVLVEKGAAGAKRGDLNKAILVRVLEGVADRLRVLHTATSCLQAATGHDASDSAYGKVMKELCGQAGPGNVWRLRHTVATPAGSSAT